MTSREDFVAVALSYAGTPYHLGGRLKHVGVDCATFLFMALRESGLIPDEKIGVFADDWFAHTRNEVYLRRLLRHAGQVAEAVAFRSLAAEPGNLILTRCAGAHVYNHGAIVIAWPRIIHAVAPQVEEVDVTQHWLWANRQVVILDPFNRPALMETGS